MFSNFEAEKLINEYKQELSKNTKKFSSLIIKVLPFTVSFLIVFFLVSDVTQNSDTLMIVVAFLVIFLIGFISFIFIYEYNSIYKTRKSVLFKRIYEKIRDDLELEITYVDEKKTDNTFVLEGGLFNKQSRVVVSRNIIGKTENNNEFSFYDLQLIVGSGQYQQIQHNGLYYIIKFESDYVIQVRSKGKPQTKKYSFKQVEEVADFKVYIEHNKNFTGIDKMIVAGLRDIKDQLLAKSVYLSIDKNVIHFAAQKKNRIKYKREVDFDFLNFLYNEFKTEILVLDKLVEKISLS